MIEQSYKSYLVRLWKEGPTSTGESIWHIELESVQTAHRRQFPDLCSMLQYLEKELDDPEPNKPNPDEDSSCFSEPGAKT